MTRLSSVISAVLLASSIADAANTPKYSDDVLNCHVFAHTHDDPGWLKTVDQYYRGSNQTIHEANVNQILDTVIPQLLQNPDFRFVYAEMSFFQRWWKEQNEARRTEVRKLVKSGQLEFVNAGWVMHDQAAPYYVSMIDQMTLGHKFVRDEFDTAPRTGWAIDPFGHSATAASLASEMGMDAVYFGRIHYQDREQRMRDGRMEVLWQGSPSMGASTSLLAGIIVSGNYQSPVNQYCSSYNPVNDPNTKCIYLGFEQDFTNVATVVDDIDSPDYNLPAMVDTLVWGCQDQMAKNPTSNHVHVQSGTDWAWHSLTQAKNMDKLIKYAQQDGRVNVFYSTPHLYAQAKAEEEIVFTVKGDSFMPYADDAHSYWTGYYTSRPTLKRFERVSSAALQSSRQMAVGTRMPVQREIMHLAEATGLCLHHDAITGTEKEHVASDYKMRMDKALTAAEKTRGAMLADLAFRRGGKDEGKALRREKEQASVELPTLPQLTECRLSMNETVCATTQAVTEGEITVVVYNPLPRSRTTQITVPLSASHAAVLTDEMKPLMAQVLPSSPPPNANDPDAAARAAPFELVFTAEGIPALATTRYVVRVGSVAGQEHLAAVSRAENVHLGVDVPVVVQQGNVRVTLSGATGKLTSLERLDLDGARVSLTEDIAYYKAFGSPGVEQPEYDEQTLSEMALQRTLTPQQLNLPSFSRGVKSGESQPSGAYIFRTTELLEKPTPAGDANAVVSMSIIRGAEVTEVRQVFADWATNTLRLRRGSNAVEVEWTVGPVPLEDGVGKEVIVKFSSDLRSQGKVWTDSNGRDFMLYERNKGHSFDLVQTEPVAGNYYPISSAAYIRDERKGLQLSVLTDRGQGAASLEDGSIEVLVHRRLLADDWRGVGEPLDETAGITSYVDTPAAKRLGTGITVRGTFHLLLSTVDVAMSEVRPAMDSLFLNPVVAYGMGKEATAALALTKPAPSMLGYDLPKNVHLVSLEPWTSLKRSTSMFASSRSRSVLVRLGHQFGADEDVQLSQTATVDLAALLSPLGSITGITEMALSASMTLQERLDTMVAWKAEGGIDSREAARAAADALGPASDYRNIKLTPMKLRTFIVDLA